MSVYYPCWGRERGYPSLRRRGKWSPRHCLNKRSNAGGWRVRYITKKSPQSLRPMLDNSKNGRRAWRKRRALRAGLPPRRRLYRFWKLSPAAKVGHATAHNGPPTHFAQSAHPWRPPPLPRGGSAGSSAADLGGRPRRRPVGLFPAASRRATSSPALAAPLSGMAKWLNDCRSA